MVAGAYWEAAAEAGFESTYLGMFDQDGQVVTVADLLDRGEKSDLIVMSLAKTPGRYRGKITPLTLKTHQRRIERGELTHFVADIECIFRFGFPLGSSFFKKVYKAAGLADYEDRATYDEVAAGLDKIRAVADILDLPAMKAVLEQAGISFIPNPGYIMDDPVLGYTTKFDPAGDKDLTNDELVERLGVDGWDERLLANAHHQRDFCLAREVYNVDGKTEVVRPLAFADFACTMDENRLMLLHDGWLIPTNKEIQRAIFRDYGVYAAIDEAKTKYGDDWLGHLYEFINRSVIEDATHESIWMMEQAIGEVANRLLGVDVFQADPIDSWVGPFMPYGSRLQVE